jgi:4-hydroxy 2-oxovalerate aldolase
MATEIYVQDVSLRDGMHAMRHRITPERVGAITRALDGAGVAAIEIAHGDGLAGSSLNYGPGSHTDWEWIDAAVSNCERAVITTLLLPGVGTIADLRRAHALGVRSVRVATHCTEADVAAQHIAEARSLGMDVSGFLMMSHLIGPADLARQAALMESYGAQCVYITDSSGRLMPEDVRDRVRAYRDVLDPATEIGIHAHENLSLAVRRCGSVQDHAAEVLAVAHVLVALIHVGEFVRGRHKLVELELALLVQAQQPRDVPARVRSAEDAADQLLLLKG